MPVLRECDVYFPILANKLFSFLSRLYTLSYLTNLILSKVMYIIEEALVEHAVLVLVYNAVGAHEARAARRGGRRGGPAQGGGGRAGGVRHQAVQLLVDLGRGDVG